MTPHEVLQEKGIQAILAQPYARFSGRELARRRRALTEVMRQQECDAVVICGEQRAGSGVFWLTGWPTTSEAMVLFDGREQDVLWVEYHNHVPNARRMACDADVRWGERKGAVRAAEEIRRRGLRRVGVIGLLSWRKGRELASVANLIDLGHAYQSLRMRKSDEEIEWMRIGAALTDLGLEALLREARVGMTERELGAIIESAYLPLGGTTVIHFIGVNAMDAPDTCVPPQFHSPRKLQRGDMMFVELTATFWDSPGQVLRTIAVGAEPTPLFRSLYDTAEQAFNAVTGVLRAGVSAAEIVEASRVIEANGFTIYDDVVHGFGGGYWPPVLGAGNRDEAALLPDVRLEPNMTIVVQPNVTTLDRKAGVQIGELVRVTPSGFERLHHAPWQFLRIA